MPVTFFPPFNPIKTTGKDFFFNLIFLGFSPFSALLYGLAFISSELWGFVFY